MKLIIQSFLSLLILVIGFVAPHTTAHLKVTLETPELRLIEEGYRLSDEGSDYYYLSYDESNFFDFRDVKLKTSFEISEADFNSIGANVLKIDNPVTNVEVNKLFGSPTINNSSLSIWLEPLYEDTYSYYWSLILDITTNHMPHEGATQRGHLSASGSFDTKLQNGTSDARFDFYQDNWLYQRASGGPWELDVHSIFHNYEAWTTVEKVSVPEPVPLFLLLSCLVSIFLVRQRKHAH